jgi:hypothetical protein
MFIGIRRAAVSTAAALSLGVFAVPAAQANVLSLLPGSCGNQAVSQPFTAYGDNSNYTPVPGGDFAAGSIPWSTTGAASAAGGAMSLPAGSSALSPANCTSIYHPTLRLFVLNTGSSSSRLTVEALYPGLLGGVQTAKIGELTGSSSWSPSPALSIQGVNLLATLSLGRTAIAFRFIPADDTGNWSISSVYLDPFGRH